MGSLSEKLCRKQVNVYDTNESREDIFMFSEDYKKFLDVAKTERLSVKESVSLLEAAGFVNLSTKSKLSYGDKVYEINKNKGLIAAVIGVDSLDAGVNIVASHIDAPRLDLKANPLYEDSSIALLKTHYYGGIKKYQWTTVPLALYGVVYLADGTKVEVSVGDGEDDPCFYISDLLIHLAGSQMSKKVGEAIEGENLNLLAGSIPVDDKDEKDRVKLMVLSILNEKYGITEDDFVSAELEAVPAGRARDIGFDRSLIGAYGHDDRVCSYCGLRAIVDAEPAKKTSVLVLADKEETGSAGNTGMKSAFYFNFIGELCKICDSDYVKCIGNSFCLSADVCNALDPQYPSVSERNNAAALNCGVALLKYTGARGKSGTSDASAELVSRIRNLFNSNSVVWQTAELGKVDEGGGGTVAQYIANLDVETIDCGVPLLSMHAPMEIASKADVYMAYKAYKAFYEFN